MRLSLLTVVLIMLVSLMIPMSNMPQDLVGILESIEYIEIYCQSSEYGTTNGVYTVVTTDNDNYYNMLQYCYNVGGVTVAMPTSYGVDSIMELLSLQSVSMDATEQYYYGYSHKISGYIVVDSTKINVQIAVLDDVILIGYPILLGNY